MVEHFFTSLRLEISVIMEAFTSDSTSEVEVLLHHGYSSCVDSAQVGVFEQASKVALGGLLESDKGVGLEAKLRINAFSYDSYEALEGGPSEH